MRGYNREEVLKYLRENDAELTSTIGMKSVIYPDTADEDFIIEKTRKKFPIVGEGDMLACYYSTRIFSWRWIVLTESMLLYRSSFRVEAIDYTYIHSVEREENGLRIWLYGGKRTDIFLPIKSGWLKVLLEMLSKDGAAIRRYKAVEKEYAGLKSETEDRLRDCDETFGVSYAIRDLLKYCDYVIECLRKADWADEEDISDCLIAMHSVCAIRCEQYEKDMNKERIQGLNQPGFEELIDYDLKHFKSVMELNLFRLHMGASSCDVSTDDVIRNLEIFEKKRKKVEVEKKSGAKRKLSEYTFGEDDITDYDIGCSRKAAKLLERLIGEQPEFDVFLGRKTA